MVQEQKAREFDVVINLQKHAEQRMVAAQKEARQYTEFLFAEQKKKDLELKQKLEAADAERARLEAERKQMLEEKKKADEERERAEEARKKAEEEAEEARKKAEAVAAELAKATAAGANVVASTATVAPSATANSPAASGLAGKTIAHVSTSGGSLSVPQCVALC
jgi:hypothetical protein